MLPKVIAIVGIALASPLANAARPDPVTSYPPDWPHRAPWKLNRELLLPETERIVFVVDTTLGSPPMDETLDQLTVLAAKYGGRPTSWVRLGDPGAPKVKWVEPPGPPKPLRFYVRLRDRESLEDVHLSKDQLASARTTIEIPACPDGALPERVSYVFVRYVGFLGRDYGNADVVTSDASCGGRAFPVVRVAQTNIALGRPPGIDQAFLEQRALAHEYGHVLGLGSNPAHGRWMSTLPYRGGPHCTHRECAVHVPTAMALLNGLMSDYCEACVHDIEQAREHWRTGAEFSEVARRPQPDPAAHVASLKKYNFHEGGEADKLVGYGKAVMPALMGRIAELPGGSAASPRAYAARLALRIVLAEDELRRPLGSPDPGVPDAAVDPTAALMSWWGREEERFLGGDDWAPPPVLRIRDPAGR